MAKTFDKPGRGRKKCPKCEIYIACRSHVCNCGYEFETFRASLNNNSVVSAKPTIEHKPKPIKIFYEKGRGRKQCRNCKLYVTSRLKTCSCGSTSFILQEKKTRGLVKAQRSFNEEGIGRKQCPECRAYVSISVGICICGKRFVKGELTKFKKQQENIKWTKKRNINIVKYAMVLNFVKGKVVDIPAGSSGVKLDGLRQENINKFCYKIINKGFDKGCLYTPDAIKYFTRKQCDINSKRYRRVSHKIDSWAKNLLDNAENIDTLEKDKTATVKTRRKK